MSYSAIAAVTADVTFGYATWANAVREQLLGLGQLQYLGPLNQSRGYRRLGTDYELPDDYGVVPINWDRLGTGWNIFALFELIVDEAGSPAETGQVEVVNMSGLVQVVEMTVPVEASDWTFQSALVIPSSTGIKYYGARVKGSDASVGVGMFGGIYRAMP